MLKDVQRQRIHAVRATTRIQHVTREHRVEAESAHRDPGATQHEDVVLRVLRNLSDRRILEHLDECAAGVTVEWRQVLGRLRDLVRLGVQQVALHVGTSADMQERQVIRLARCGRNRDADHA